MTQIFREKIISETFPCCIRHQILVEKKAENLPIILMTVEI